MAVEQILYVDCIVVILGQALPLWLWHLFLLPNRPREKLNPLQTFLTFVIGNGGGTVFYRNRFLFLSEAPSSSPAGRDR